jgi:hypothetical protein
MEDEMVVDAAAKHEKQVRLPKVGLARELRAFRDHPEAGPLPTAVRPKGGGR